ncbi:MAG: energy-coupling factor ABC transporter permease [Candidatus Bathyarchaeia archaeon]
MHIPDGFISLPVIIVTFTVTLLFWVVSFVRVKGTLDERQVPLMGMLTALFFAAQMMNYPIIGGTTGHLLGGAAIGIILGPYAGCISMSIILILQCLLFGDGGITALGANVLNMGIIGVVIPAVLLLAINKVSRGKALYAGVFIASFTGDVLAAVAAGIELGFSVPIFQYGLSVAVPAMAINHSVIGVIEGVVTMALVGFLVKLRPDIMQHSVILKRFAVKNDEKQVSVKEEC